MLFHFRSIAILMVHNTLYNVSWSLLNKLEIKTEEKKT